MKLSPVRDPDIDISIVEAKRDAKFIGCFPIGDRNQYVYVFYNKEKHPQGSNYFGLYYNYAREDWFIIDAGEVEKKEYCGILRPDDTILHSYHRHNYVNDEHGNMVDGGNEYFKHYIKWGRAITFNFKDGKIVEINAT